VEQVARRLEEEEAAMRRRCEPLLDTLACVRQASAIMNDMRNALPALHAMFEIIRKEEIDEDSIAPTRRLVNEQFSRLSDLRSLLEAFEYPFEHADGRVSLARYALSKVPAPGDWAAVYNTCSECLNALGELYHRTAGELALICEGVERVLKLDQARTNAVTRESSA
jgi:hypothetical protein